MRKREEDEVRDGAIIDSVFIAGAKQILGLDKVNINENAKQGTGQIYTFNKLGFAGINDKPDGWYLPEDKSKVAIILEIKKEDTNISNQSYVDEILKNVKIVNMQYSKVIGILYNGIDVRVFKNFIEITKEVSPTLQDKSYYFSLYNNQKLDKDHIYQVTQRINNSLHFKFGMMDLQERMIFTACALVAQRYNPVNGLQKLKGMSYSIFHNWIFNALSKAIEKDKNQNSKLEVLLEEYSAVKMSITEEQKAIDSFIDDICEIAELVNSDNWNGEDVMAIFFNEFNRYRKKSDAGQIFTPDHMTSFMYRLIGVSAKDRVLDATCGSGAFLVKSMCNMFKEVGGIQTIEAQKIKSEQLYGIEMYRKVFALACANMMIHKDGKTNLAQMDAKSEEAGKWIHEKGITKVLMNPPYERKYGCMKIVANVLNNVPKGTKCAFILPDKKLEKDGGKNLLKNHRVETIIKMPENTFFGVGVTTSIFVFEAGVPQGTRNIIGYYIEDDGLETVKNKGRQDVKNRWNDIEDYWIQAIQDGNDSKYNTRQIIDPNKYLSYQMPEKEFEIYEEDFVKTMMDYLMFEKNIDAKEFNEKLLNKVLYSGFVSLEEDIVNISLKGVGKNG